MLAVCSSIRWDHCLIPQMVVYPAQMDNAWERIPLLLILMGLYILIVSTTAKGATAVPNIGWCLFKGASFIMAGI